MSSAVANPQHEPTMEEILASIRKIISEDQPEPEKPAVAQPVLRQVVPDPKPQPAAEMDVLELTEEVKDEQSAAAATPRAKAVDDDITFETIETPQKKTGEPAMDTDTDSLISDSTRSAVGRAFAGIDKNSEHSAPSGGSIESIFVQAVQNAFSPTLQDWVDTHQNEIMDKLKPLIREWMDENLPPLVATAVAKEIGRASGRTRKK